jgi:hypothetical protein
LKEIYYFIFDLILFLFGELFSSKNRLKFLRYIDIVRTQHDSVICFEKKSCQQRQLDENMTSTTRQFIFIFVYETLAEVFYAIFYYLKNKFGKNTLALEQKIINLAFEKLN